MRKIIGLIILVGAFCVPVNAEISTTYTAITSIKSSTSFNVENKHDPIADPNNAAGGKIAVPSTYTPVVIKMTGIALTADGGGKVVTVTKTIGNESPTPMTLKDIRALLGTQEAQALVELVALGTGENIIQ